MKLSANWIRDFVDLTVDDSRLAQDLTDVGLGVEGIEGHGADTVFEVEIGTNRPDAMNHYGVAREAAAIYDRPLKQLSGLGHQPSANASTAFSVTVEEPALCPRFTARAIRNTRIKASPDKISHRLQLLDQRPISNAVDATNYVLWEIGKPTHVFDAD
ncbi:MAG TPA: phenylalanine--tRNA ligase beta subunit-related protein, partial [Candidatus Acidoferrum sp.]|nr:phenylalanine--tRNA ligase beta subunit-related protein [Candidatus Acidoferrum sp.]